MNKLIGILLLFFVGCSTMSFEKTVDYVDMDRFMGDWYVIAGRVTFLEKGAFNPLEQYKWNNEKERIDISFTFNKDSFDGKRKSIPQKGWIENKETNAHWKVSPFWPLKFDYLVVGLGKDYDWTAIGVPDQKYLWIMARTKELSKDKLDEILSELKSVGYDTNNLEYFKHQ